MTLYEVLAGADRLEEGGRANCGAVHLPALCACVRMCMCMREVTVNLKGIQKKNTFIPQSDGCLKEVTEEKLGSFIT